MRFLSSDSLNICHDFPPEIIRCAGTAAYCDSRWLHRSGANRCNWAKALEALRDAGRIFIIGYSIASTDQFFRYMLALALAANEKLDRVVIANTSADAQKTFQDLFQSECASDFLNERLAAIDHRQQIF
jgi:hypothetical protein